MYSIVLLFVSCFAHAISISPTIKKEGQQTITGTSYYFPEIQTSNRNIQDDQQLATDISHYDTQRIPEIQTSNKNMQDDHQTVAGASYYVYGAYTHYIPDMPIRNANIRLSGSKQNVSFYTADGQLLLKKKYKSISDEKVKSLLDKAAPKPQPITCQLRYWSGDVDHGPVKNGDMPREDQEGDYILFYDKHLNRITSKLFQGDIDTFEAYRDILDISKLSKEKIKDLRNSDREKEFPYPPIPHRTQWKTVCIAGSWAVAMAYNDSVRF